jgi:hypothetical protein
VGIEVDGVAFGLGAIVGYFFIDVLKSALSLLTSLPPLLIFIGGVGLLWYFKGSKIRLSGDLLMGLGFGLGIRGQMS